MTFPKTVMCLPSCVCDTRRMILSRDGRHMPSPFTISSVGLGSTINSRSAGGTILQGNVQQEKFWAISGGRDGPEGIHTSTRVFASPKQLTFRQKEFIYYNRLGSAPASNGVEKHDAWYDCAGQPTSQTFVDYEVEES